LIKNDVNQGIYHHAAGRGIVTLECDTADADATGR
jgi:hypothetical protein